MATKDGASEVNYHTPQASLEPVMAAIKPSSTNYIFSQTLPTYRKHGRALGVAFEDVTVHGATAGQGRAPDVLRLIQDILVDVPVNLVRKIAHRGHTQPTRKIIQNISGVVPPGETLLVLGRPGAGCTTLLNVLANKRATFVDVGGAVQYGPIQADEMKRHYGSEVIMNGEDDNHFPTLKVKHTLDFALRLRKPKSNSESESAFADEWTDKILASLGIQHTKETIVGNDYIRGVSGGERKRVSLAEVLATAPALVCWDNPLRGLDSSSAQGFCTLLKTLSEVTGMVNIVTAYQVSESIYRECFDRVLVLYEGHMIYSGPAGDHPKNYFEQMGFEYPQRMTTPDFLTAITSVEERRIKQGHVPPPPITPAELAAAFRQSSLYECVKQKIATFHDDQTNKDRENAFRSDVASTRTKLGSKTQLEVSSFAQQLVIAMRRHHQLLLGHRRSLAMILFMNATNGLIFGSAFYKPPATATGAFQISGALFFSVIYFALNALGETASTVGSRIILRKQHQLGMLHPAIACIAQNLAELPMVFFQTVLFTIPFYFLLGLGPAAGRYWFFELIIFVFYAAALAMFRMVGAWAPNVPVAFLLGGCALPVILLYSGYAITWPSQLRWGSWLRRASPSPFALEALLGFEMAPDTLYCTPDQLVPHGPGYENVTIANQGCPISGSTIGSSAVPASDYLWSHFNFLPSNAWRNFGIILCFWVGYTVLTAIGLSFTTKERGGQGSGHVFKRSAQIAPIVASGDEEMGGEKASGSVDICNRHENNTYDYELSEATQVDENMDSSSVQVKGESRPSFTFSDVSYHVNVNGESKQLLNSISGFVKPGQLTALMGVSGAGKTTLLEILVQRKDTGIVSGNMLVGGCHVRDLGDAFSRACGFCMQQDIHDPGATVREALLFSAMMRRPPSVRQSEKEAKVDEIMHLLNLEPIADALIGTPGEGGLGVEERKRVTIGVELAANPTMLLFLDEPTSGLDSHAAYSLVQFLKKIAASGVPIVCTIHQPSAVIFELFDRVLLLAKGGRTVYFGETGINSCVVADYFARNGAAMHTRENPAEFILSIVAELAGADTWSRIWNDSPEAREVKAEIESINASSHDAVVSVQNEPVPFIQQYIYLTQRHSRTIWRDGFYSLSRIVKAVFMSLFFSFSYFQASQDEQGIQNHLLVMLIWQWAVPAATQDLQAVWFAKWELYGARERSGVGYHPLALCTALCTIEVPIAVAVHVLFYFCAWWTVGFDSAGLGFLLFVALGMFGIGYSFVLAALFGSEEVTGYANSLFWCIFSVFSGTVIPHSSMITFYRWWLYYLSPLTYWSSSAASSVLHDLPVHCKSDELTYFNPPTGLTCGEYLADFLSRTTTGGASNGYVSNPNAIDQCAYCPYRVGDDYVISLDYHYVDRWRDWGIFTALCASTLGLVFLGTWLKYLRWHSLFRREKRKVA